MEQRYKYSLNGVYKCDNFAQHVENNDFPILHFGYVSGINWFIGLTMKNINGTTVVYPLIYSGGNPKTQVRAYFNTLKKDGSSAFEREFGHTYLEPNEGCRGFNMKIEDLLDEGNGYLDNGTLTIEYGFQVESEQGEDGIWMFNFLYLFYNWQSQDNMFCFTIEHGKHLFGHKQIVRLHSKTIPHSNKTWVQVPKSITIAQLIMCLQITHGVRLQPVGGAAYGGSPPVYKDYRNVARIVFHFGFSNTVRYCERQLIEMELTSNTEHVGMALKCNMRYYLVHQLKQIETKEQLVKIMRGLDLEKISSESMKAIVAKIFSL